MFFAFQTPSSARDWLTIAKDFERKWNYPSNQINLFAIKKKIVTQN